MVVRPSLILDCTGTACVRPRYGLYGPQNWPAAAGEFGPDLASFPLHKTPWNQPARIVESGLSSASLAALYGPGTASTFC
jgi:hypothetical protein